VCAFSRLNCSPDELERRNGTRLSGFFLYMSTVGACVGNGTTVPVAAFLAS